MSSNGHASTIVSPAATEKFDRLAASIRNPCDLRPSSILANFEAIAAVFDETAGGLPPIRHLYRLAWAALSFAVASKGADGYVGGYTLRGDALVKDRRPIPLP